MAKRPKLSEDEWRQVFKLRCRSKSGFALSKTDMVLIRAALKEDPDRYLFLES